MGSSQTRFSALLLGPSFSSLSPPASATLFTPLSPGSRALRTMNQETYDTLLSLSLGTFKIPIKQRSRVQKNAVIQYWRNKACLSAKLVQGQYVLFFNDRPITPRTEWNKRYWSVIFLLINDIICTEEMDLTRFDVQSPELILSNKKEIPSLIVFMSHFKCTIEFVICLMRWRKLKFDFCSIKKHWSFYVKFVILRFCFDKKCSQWSFFGGWSGGKGESWLRIILNNWELLQFKFYSVKRYKYFDHVDWKQHISSVYRFSDWSLFFVMTSYTLGPNLW
jgi:hypothetical protein